MSDKNLTVSVLLAARDQMSGAISAVNDELARLSGTTKASAAATAAANKEGDAMVASLRRQVDTYGMTRGQVAAYDAQMRGLTGTHLESARSLAQQIDALDANEKMLVRVKVAAAAAGAAIGLFAVAAGRQMMAEVLEAEQSTARLEAVLRATGGAARLTLADIEALSAELAKNTLFDQEDIQDAAAMMLTFKNVQGDTFRQAMQMAADLAATFNTDLKSAVLQLGKALEDPEDGLTALRRSGVSFSDAQKDMIKQLVETGRQGEALTMILETMRKQGLDGVARAMKDGLTKETDELGKAWKDLLQTIGETESVGGTAERVFGRMALYLEDMRNVIESGDWADKLAFFMTGGGWKTDRIKSMRGEGGGASGSWGGGASGSWGDDADSGETKAQKEAREKAEKAAAAAAKAAAREYAQAVARSKDYVASLHAETAALTMTKDQQAAVNMAKEAARAPTEKLRAAIMAAAGANLLERQRLADLEAAEKQRQQTLEKLAQAQKAATDAARKDAASIAGQVKRQREMTEEYGLTAEGMRALEQARLDNAIAAEEQLEIEKTLAGAAIEEIEAIWDKIDALKELKKASAGYYDRKASVDAGKAAADAADKAAAEWQRASDDIERSLTDALLRGFEGGKGFVDNFKDTLKNMFESLVLRPIIQPIAQMGSNMVMGMLGMGGMGASGSAMAGGMGGVGDIFGIGSSLMGAMAPGAISTGAGVVVGGIAESLGASSAFAGSLGAGVATALPWLGAIAAIGSAFGLFGGKPSNKSAGGVADLTTGQVSDLWNMTGDKQASQQTMDARSLALTAIGGYGTTLTALGATSLPYERIGVDIGERDGVQFNLSGDPNGGTYYGDDLNQALGQLFRELALGAEGLSETLQTLLGHFDGTAEEFATFTGALVTLQEYAAADPLTAAAEAAEAAGRSAWQVWQQQGADLRTALAAWDGSAAATADLAALTQARYQTEYALAQQINAALASTSAMFATTAEEMRYSTLDQAGQYAFLEDRALALEEAMRAALDPAEIESLAATWDATARQAWQLLGEEERKIKIGEYEAAIAEMDKLTTDRLNAAGESITAERDDSLPTNIQTAIETAMDRVAAQFMAAAQAQQAAAETPVTVNFNANVPGDAEVVLG